MNVTPSGWMTTRCVSEMLLDKLHSLPYVAAIPLPHINPAWLVPI